MPLLFTRRLFENTAFGIWRIAEEEHFFSEKTTLEVYERQELEQFKPGSLRRLEWWAARYLLHLLSDSPLRLPLAKDAFSKPFFIGKDSLHCSLSHSNGIVSALIAPVNCGCDIQLRTPKALSLAPRFLSAEELAEINAAGADSRVDLAHVYWTAKESLYKLWGTKNLDFRRDIRVWDWAEGKALSGKVERDGRVLRARLHTEKMALPDHRNMIWTACIEVSKENSQLYSF